MLGVYLVSSAKAFDGAAGVLGSLVREVSSELKGKGLRDGDELISKEAIAPCCLECRGRMAPYRSIVSHASSTNLIQGWPRPC